MAQPTAKRRKTSMSAPQLRKLTKIMCDLPVELLTPAASQSSRIVMSTYSEDATCASLYLATGQQIYKAGIEVASHSSFVSGLDGLSLPTTSVKVPASRLKAVKLPAEIQSLALLKAPHAVEHIVAAVDAYGTAALLKAGTDADSYGQPVVLTNLSSRSMEPGWAGIAVSDSVSEPRTATACAFGRVLNFYQGERQVRSLGTLHQPNAVAYLMGASSQLLGVAEGHQVTLWDSRTAEKRGCTTRMATGGSSAALLCVSGDVSGEYIATGGVESTAFVFDLRRPGLPVARWPGCVKHDVISIHFPVNSCQHVVVGGSDQEVSCNFVDAKVRKATSIRSTPLKHASRVDDRLLGVHRAADSNTFACFAASSHIFLADLGFRDSSDES